MTQSAVSSCVVTNTSCEEVDLQKLFQQSSVVENASVPYLRVQRHMSFKQFLNLLPTQTPGIVGWKSCTQCRESWKDLSTLATPMGEPVYLGGSKELYGEAWPAVDAYQKSFRQSPLLDHVVYYVDNACHESPNFGFKIKGAGPDSVPYNHCFLETGLTPVSNVQKAQYDKINQLIHMEISHLERYLKEWSPDVISQILAWYLKKGENAPGYRVNTGGLRFMNKLQDEYKIQTNPRLGRAIVIKHLVNLFKGDHPDDRLGALHIFANGSNLAACRRAQSQEEFWSIMDQRYNPVTYKQPTSTPSEGQVNHVLSLVNNDLSCFERVHLSRDDPHVVKRSLFRYSDVSPLTSMSPAQLLEQVKQKKTNVSHKKTCFDKPYQRDQDLNVDQFESWLKSLPEGSTLEHKLSYRVCPIELGKPTTQTGLDMVKVPVGWVLPQERLTPRSVGLSNEWYKINQITYHPGRWLHQSGDDFPISSRESAIVADGYVLEMQHTWNPNASCLFSQFFRGKYHSLDSTRQELQRSLRIAPIKDTVTFRGILLQVSLLNSVWGLSEPVAFRATLPGGTIQSVIVQ